MTNFAIRTARPDDAEQLSILAQRSKAHWGYDEEFLSAFRSELTIRPQDVVRRRTQVAVAAVGTAGAASGVQDAPRGSASGEDVPGRTGSTELTWPTGRTPTDPAEPNFGQADPAEQIFGQTEPEERIIGFVTLEGEPPAGELGMLFVDPDVIGQGVGTGLFKHLSALATQLGFHRLTIASDPFAEPFYLARGAVRIGAVPSGSIPGRSLPLLAVAL